MNSCNKVSELLSTYLDGEVTEKEKELVEYHLKECTLCKQKLDIMKKAQNILKSAPPMPVPETLLKDFEEYRKKEEQTEKKVVPFYKNYRLYASIAAIFIFAFVLKSGLWQEDKFAPEDVTDSTQTEQFIDSAESTPEVATFNRARTMPEPSPDAAAYTPAVADAEIAPADGAIAAYDGEQDVSPAAAEEEKPKAATYAIIYVAEEHLNKAASYFYEGKYFYSQIEQKLNDNRIPFESNILSLDESVPHKVIVMVKGM